MEKSAKLTASAKPPAKLAFADELGVFRPLPPIVPLVPFTAEPEPPLTPLTPLSRGSGGCAGGCLAPRPVGLLAGGAGGAGFARVAVVPPPLLLPTPLPVLLRKLALSPAPVDKEAARTLEDVDEGRAAAEEGGGGGAPREAVSSWRYAEGVQPCAVDSGRLASHHPGKMSEPVNVRRRWPRPQLGSATHRCSPFAR